jgi:hypothetical protein
MKIRNENRGRINVRDVEKTAFVRGRVVKANSPTESGYGLVVEASLRTGKGIGQLARAWTRGDGSFVIDGLIEGATAHGNRIELRVLGLDGRQMATRTISSATAFDQRVTLAVSADAFDEHRVSLVKLDGPEPWFVPVPEMAESIARAVPLVATPGSPEFARFREAARCPLPPYRQMNELYRDAYGVLSGDPGATRRFIDGLELMGESIPPLARDTQISYTTRDTQPHVHRNSAPSDGPLVPPAKTIPIFAAGAMLARANLYNLDRFTSTMSFVMCGFEQFGLVLRAALDAFTDDASRSHFASLLDWRVPECGPLPSAGHPGPSLPERHKCIPWLNWHEECLNAVVDEAESIPPPYVITSVTPLRACPGDAVSIVGTNFGSTTGLVVFRRLGGSTIEVTATQWTNTRITVTVPQQAAIGLWLKIPIKPIVACGMFLERYMSGIAFETFDGSIPYIDALYAGHSPNPPFVVEPGELLNVNWRVFGATRVTVEVFNQAGVSMVRSDPAPSIGAFTTLAAPVSNVTTRLRVRVDAAGICVPTVVRREIEILVTKDPLLSIEGIEVTQSVQHFRSAQHLTDSKDYGADNSLPIVAGKAARARVYVRSFRDPLFDNGKVEVTGSLLVERLDNASQVLSSMTLNPTLGSVFASASPVYTDQRGHLDKTVNFTIPDSLIAGRVRLTATITQPPTTYTFSVSPMSVTIDPLLNRQLRIAFIPIGYNGPKSPTDMTMKTVSAPDLANVLTSLSDTLTMLPVTGAPDIRTLPTHTRTEVLADGTQAAGGCFTNVGDLMADVDALVANDGRRTDVVYVALYAHEIPLLYGGCGGGNLAVFENEDPLTGVHEISHALGRAHAPCSKPGTNVGTPDPNYPAYEPYDTVMARTAMIGEYGLDIRNGTIHPPQEHDFMSYCDPFWVSPYGYLYTNGHLPGQPVPVPTAGGTGGFPATAGAMREPISLLWMSGVIMDGDRCNVRRVAQVELQEVPGGRVLPFVAELLDAKGVRLATASLRRVSHAGCGCDDCSSGADGSASQDPQAPVRFHVHLPVMTKAARLRIRRGETELWARNRPKKRPRVEISHSRVERDGGLAISWRSTVDAATVPEVWLQWRRNEDKQWRALQVGLTENQAWIPPVSLPSGSVRLRVLLHDGFSTANAESGLLHIPARAPQVGIINPTEGMTAEAGSTVLLWGYATNCEGQSLPGESLTWRVNGKVIGHGRTLPLHLTGAKRSRYAIELEATDEHGTARTRSVTTYVRNRLADS